MKQEQNINEKRINCTKFLELPSGQKFKLTSVVIYDSYHYTCYFNAPYEHENDAWFYYNDHPESKIEEIGTYEDLISDYEEVLTHGIIYKYSLIETDIWDEDLPLQF